MIILRLLLPHFILAVQLVSEALAANVTWGSPAAGDVYIPGDTLQAVWTSTEKVVSPSFTICAVDNNTNANDDTDCGTAVWPPVDQNGTEYSISLAVPNITENGDYYLVMKDDQGAVYDTPDFSLAPTKIANTTANTNVTSSLAPDEPTGTSIQYLPSHSAPSIAAIAIPLSLVAATLLIALFLLLYRMRRSRQRELDKQRDTRASEKFGSQQSTFSFASATDIERAVLALAAARGYGSLAQHAFVPPQPVNPGIAYGAPGLGAAAAAAALGMGAFGWAHGFGQVPPAVPVMSDAYTPAPVPQYAGSASQQHVTHSAPTPPPHSLRDSTRYDQEALSRHVTSDRTFASGAVPAQSQSSMHGPPQLPEIQLHVSSPPPHVQDSPPPPLPPKQLFPGSLLNHVPHTYDLPFTSQPLSDAPPMPGAEAHASLSVISNYMHASPALAQGSSHLAPPPNDLQALQVPPSSLTRLRSLRRLETISETEKPLPVRPEERVGTDLYDAVSRAVGRVGS